MTRDEALRRLANDWNDAWNSRDANTLAAFFAEGGTYYEPENPGAPRPGVAGITESAERTWRQWPDATFEAVSVIVDGAHVALEWRSSAKTSSGQALTLEGVDLLSFDDDNKLVAVRVYYDVHQRNLAQ